MRKSSIPWFLALAFLCLPATAESPKAPDVVLISLDGLRPEFCWDERWPAPCLQSLRKRGAAARTMLPVFPSITYANHASLVTGVSPATHGIDCNIDFDWETGPKPGWNWEASKLKAPALWQLAARRGISCAAFSWPVSLGAGMAVNIPEVFHVPGANQGTTESLIREASTPGLIEEIQARHPGPFPVSFEEWDAWLPSAVHHVWRTRKPQLTLIHMLNLDWVQHRFGPAGEETRQALARLDRDLERLIAPLDLNKTVLMVVGDHGFLEVEKSVSLNRLFLDEGWITMSGDRIASWKVLARTNGGSAAILCKSPELMPKVEAVLLNHSGQRYQILDRAELDRRRTFSEARLAVSARPGYAFTASPRAAFEVETPRKLGQHGHLPEWVPTTWIMVGPGIRAGQELGSRQLLEVAPTIGRILNLDTQTMEYPGLDLELLP